MNENMEFPSNSKNANVGPSSGAETPKKGEKIIKGTAKKQPRSFGQKLADIFLEDNTQNVSAYLVQDVLIPAGKAMICDIVGWGGFAEMLLFGGSGGGGRRRSGGTSNSVYHRDTQSNYNYGALSRTSSRDPRATAPRPNRAISATGRARHDFSEIVIDTRGEAEDVLTRLIDLTESEYNFASVADLYDMVGIESNFADQKYGWEISDRQVWSA